MNILRKPFTYTFFRATLALILVNAAAHILFNTLPLNKNFFGLNVVCVIYNHYFWQPLTYMFVHGNFMHLFFNMFALLVFGTAVERVLGSKEFLLLYFFIGIMSGLFSFGVYYFYGRFLIANGIQPWTWGISLIGASGAVYGILFAYAVIFPRSTIFIWGIIPLPAPVMVLGYAIIEFVSQFVSSSNVAHMTHLAGFAFAYLYLLVRMGVHPIQVWKDTYRN